MSAYAVGLGDTYRFGDQRGRQVDAAHAPASRRQRLCRMDLVRPDDGHLALGDGVLSVAHADLERAFRHGEDRHLIVGVRDEFAIVAGMVQHRILHAGDAPAGAR